MKEEVYNSERKELLKKLKKNGASLITDLDIKDNRVNKKTNKGPNIK